MNNLSTAQKIGMYASLAILTIIQTFIIFFILLILGVAAALLFTALLTFFFNIEFVDTLNSITAFFIHNASIL